MNAQETYNDQLKNVEIICLSITPSSEKSVVVVLLFCSYRIITFFNFNPNFSDAHHFSTRIFSMSLFTCSLHGLLAFGSFGFCFDCIAVEIIFFDSEGLTLTALFTILLALLTGRNFSPRL